MDRNFDKYVNRNVILTNWNGIKQHVKIIRNNKEKKYLEVGTNLKCVHNVHFLTYKNIGEGCVVTNIEFDN